MSTATATAARVEGLKDRLVPAFDTLDETVRQGRRAFVRGQHAAEDASVKAALKIRRNPLSAVMIAAGAGAIVGCLFGFVAGRVAGCSQPS